MSDTPLVDACVGRASEIWEVARKLEREKAALFKHCHLYHCSAIDLEKTKAELEEALSVANINMLGWKEAEAENAALRDEIKALKLQIKNE